MLPSGLSDHLHLIKRRDVQSSKRCKQGVHYENHPMQSETLNDNLLELSLSLLPFLSHGLSKSDKNGNIMTWPVTQCAYFFGKAYINFLLTSYHLAYTLVSDINNLKEKLHVSKIKPFWHTVSNS